MTAVGISPKDPISTKDKYDTNVIHYYLMELTTNDNDEAILMPPRSNIVDEEHMRKFKDYEQDQESKKAFDRAYEYKKKYLNLLPDYDRVIIKEEDDIEPNRFHREFDPYANDRIKNTAKTRKESTKKYQKKSNTTQNKVTKISSNTSSNQPTSNPRGEYRNWKDLANRKLLWRACKALYEQNAYKNDPNKPRPKSLRTIAKEFQIPKTVLSRVKTNFDPLSLEPST